MRRVQLYITSLSLILFLAGCGGESVTAPGVAADNEEQVEPERAPSNWYIRIVAEDPSRGMRTLNTQLGEIEESDAVQKHTLKALTPFARSYLDIIFRDPVGVEAGDYKVNFHLYQEGRRDSWRFTVRTDDPNADILLSWKGLYVLTPYIDDQNRQQYWEYRSITNPLLKQMKLVDVATGTEIAAVVNGNVQTYAFTMNGETEHTFEWVVEAEPVAASEMTSRITTMNSRAVEQGSSQVTRTTMMQRETDSFDLRKLPRIREDIYGD